MLETTELIYIATLPIAYVTIFLGLLNPRRSRLLASGDYSYALYLYSLPIQQSLVATFSWGDEWVLNFGVGIAISGACAYVSWHFVESRVLAARRQLVPKVEQVARWVCQLPNTISMRRHKAMAKAARHPYASASARLGSLRRHQLTRDKARDL